jgi:nicotinic acetylcholine receptor
LYSDYETQLLKADDVRELNPAVERAMNALKFVAQHVKNEDKFESFANDWKYVAMVLDRILLWMFLAACIVGTAGIIMAAPSHYDSRKPIDVQFSKVDNKNALRMMTEE